MNSVLGSRFALPKRNALVGDCSDKRRNLSASVDTVDPVKVPSPEPDRVRSAELRPSDRSPFVETAIGQNRCMLTHHNAVMWNDLRGHFVLTLWQLDGPCPNSSPE